MFRKLLAVSAFALAAFAGSANADTVAKWTFETSVPLSAGPFSPEIGAGSATGFHAGVAAVYSNPVGNGSAESFSSTVWAIGDYYQFQVSTLGFKEISLSWDQTSSSTGPRDFKLQYSTNGTSFSDFASYSVLTNGTPNAVWSSSTSSSAYSFTYDLSGVVALNNQSNAYFRLTDRSTVSAGGTTVAATGTDRVDNFMVSATPVPEPEAYAMLLAGLAIVGFVGRGRKK